MRVDVAFLHELVERFEQATRANRETKGRRGSLIELKPDSADALVLAGDLHGQRSHFNKIVKAAALDKHPKRHLVLQEVVHGGPTYPEGGCMSHMLLEDVAALKVRFPDRFHFLLCNHELSECTRKQVSKSGKSQSHDFTVGLELAYGAAAGRIHDCYERFIRSCPLAIRLPNGVFISHSLPDREALAQKFDPQVFTRELDEADLLPGGSAYAVVWGRDYDEEHVARLANLLRADVFLTGHAPCPDGFDRPNPRQIVLDASGPHCCVLIVPAARETTTDAIIAKMHRL